MPLLLLRNVRHPGRDRANISEKPVSPLLLLLLLLELILILCNQCHQCRLCSHLPLLLRLVKKRCASVLAMAMSLDDPILVVLLLVLSGKRKEEVY